MKGFDASGIRKVFELGAKLPDPINLSIGQPDFDVPEQARAAAIEAIQGRKNGYALTQGVPLLQERLQAQVDRGYGHGDRHVFVTSGTSGGLMLALLALVDPGDEVIVFDPYFVMYNALVEVAGGKAVLVPDRDVHVQLGVAVAGQVVQEQAGDQAVPVAPLPRPGGMVPRAGVGRLPLEPPERLPRRVHQRVLELIGPRVERGGLVLVAAVAGLPGGDPVGGVQHRDALDRADGQVEVRHLARVLSAARTSASPVALA